MTKSKPKPKPVASSSPSSQIISTGSAARIRENQRRSRARQKDYIHDLEQRVRHFENLGVQASLDLQVAARKVARENAVLWELLRERGVAREEVETLMGCDRSNEYNAGDIVGAMDVVSSSLELVQRASADYEHSSTDRFRTTAIVSTAPSMTEPLEKMPTHASFQTSLLEPDPECEGYTTSKDAQIDDSTSCETAAWIIARMRGQTFDDGGLEAEIQTELGCRSDDKARCSVKNAVVFGVMDRW